MRITGFLDFNGNELDTQVQAAKKLNINNLLLRKVEGRRIYELEDTEIKLILQTLKREKLGLLALDPLISEYFLYDIAAYQDNFEKYKQTIDIARKLKVTNIYYRLPVIKNVIEEFSTIEEQLTPLVEYATKNNVTLLMYPHNTKANIMVYLMKHYKSKRLQPIYNPKEHLINRESPTVAYRLLKNDFNFFMAADIDKKNNPELLGYGKLKIVDLFKRLNRDKYNGYIILDDAFNNFIEGDEEIKRPWYKKVFKRKTTVITEYLQSYASKIFPEEPEHIVDIIDIYLNQIQVLNIVFKLRR